MCLPSSRRSTRHARRSTHRSTSNKAAMTRDINGASGVDREEPPFLFGLIGQVIARSSALVRATLQSIDQRVLIKLWGGGTLATFLLIAVAAIASAPGFAGIA